jgi:chemotaxis protein MotB
MNIGMIDLRRAGRAGLALVMAGLALGGCASQQAMDQLRDTNNTLTERNNELQRQVSELQTENGLLQKQRNASESAIAELNRQNDLLKQQLSAAGVNIDDMMKRLQGLQLSPVDPETDRALTALAAQFPDLIRYDSAKGMLRFASDLTFSSGDDQVQASARQSLEALAKVLSSGAASMYEVVIVGHTDAQPINLSTTGKRHPTNVHLSAHRAIAVRSALASMGVPQDKMMVAGWGEFRPVVPNSGPKGNTPANRRVEIYLTRPTSTSMGEESAPPRTTPGSTTNTTTPPAQTRPDYNK